MNPSYPKPDNGTNTCQVTVFKNEGVCQLRLDFEEFQLCTTDSFMVRTTVGERLPILCGDNKDQHCELEFLLEY